MKLLKQPIKEEYSVTLPSSKSISNRLLVIKHLSKSNQPIINLSDSEDTCILLKALESIENKDFNKENTNQNNTFYCKNAGTSTRFLIALLAITEGNWVVDTDKRMNERPILPLIEALRFLGAEIKTSKNNTFPIQIKGKQLSANKDIISFNSQTSQIISALVLISPYIKGTTKIKIPENQNSLPYIDMTISLVNRFGGRVEKQGNLLICRESKYNFSSCRVEDDYSSLCFILCFVCVGKLKNVKIKTLQTNTLQGDIRAIDMFKKLGLSVSHSDDYTILSYTLDKEEKTEDLVFDLKDTPDIFLPLAVASYVSGKRIVFKNLSNLRVKESNRLENIMIELNKLGERCKVVADSFIIEKGEINTNQKASFKVYDDHRMAMALSSISLICNEVEIDNIDCVTKSWKNFWKDIKDFITLKTQ